MAKMIELSPAAMMGNMVLRSRSSKNALGSYSFLVAIQCHVVSRTGYSGTSDKGPSKKWTTFSTRIHNPKVWLSIAIKTFSSLQEEDNLYSMDSNVPFYRPLVGNNWRIWGDFFPFLPMVLPWKSKGCRHSI